MPLLHSDPHVLSLPLIGMCVTSSSMCALSCCSSLPLSWVSGASLDHPSVWTSCHHYLHTPAPLDRVLSAGGKFLLVTLSQGHIDCYECCESPDSFQLLTAVLEVNVAMVPQCTGLSFLLLLLLLLLSQSPAGSSSSSQLSCELLPAVEPSAAHTVLQAALRQWRADETVHVDSLPLPSPHPAPVHHAGVTHTCCCSIPLLLILFLLLHLLLLLLFFLSTPIHTRPQSCLWMLILRYLASVR